VVDVSNAILPRRQISLIYRKNRKYTRAVQAFFGLLAEAYGASIPDAALVGVA
jgi:hypothetical protein